MQRLIIAIGITSLAMLASTANAATCSIRGISRTCEIICSGTCAGFNHAVCDNNQDGYCTICGQSGSQTIFGTSGDDWICGKGGDDLLFGAPLFQTAGGNDVISGDGGHDQISGGDGDDELFGGGGNDTIYGGNGVNALIGGTGDDVLDNSAQFSTLGATLCGGAGDDVLNAQGISGWFCLDGGKDQSGLGDCTCNDFSSATCTARYCVDPLGDITGDAPCGCED